MNIVIFARVPTQQYYMFFKVDYKVEAFPCLWACSVAPRTALRDIVAARNFVEECKPFFAWL